MLNFALEIGCETMNSVTGKQKFPTVGDLLMLLLLFVLSQVVFSAVINAFGVVAPITSAIDAVDIETYMNEQEALGRYIATIYPLSMLFSIGTLWCYVRLRGGRKTIRIRHSARGFDPIIVLVCVMWLLAAQIVLEPLMSLLPQHDGRGLGRGIWACVTAVFSAAVLEELLCRGLLFETLHRRWGAKTSILFSSLFFGLIHSELSTAIVAVVAGVIFGVMYIRTSSLFSTIIIHSINNAMAFAMISIGVGDMSLYDVIGGGVFYWVIYVVAAAIFVGCCTEAYIRVFRDKRITK